MQKNTVFLSLGTNLGDRQANLEHAVQLLAKDSRNKIIKISNYYETKPVGIDEQPNYFNSAVHLETEIEVLDFLKYIQNIEDKLGRIRLEKWGPRIIDLDIIYFNDQVIDLPDLKVPHPLMQTRYFVLKPLAEIAPNLVHPVLQKTSQQLLDAVII